MHNEKLHNSYSSPNIIRVIKSWMRKYAGRMASMREKRKAHRILVGKNKRDHLNDLGVDGTIIQGVLNKYDGREWGN